MNQQFDFFQCIKQTYLLRYQLIQVGVNKDMPKFKVKHSFSRCANSGLWQWSKIQMYLHHFSIRKIIQNTSFKLYTKRNLNIPTRHSWIELLRNFLTKLKRKVWQKFKVFSEISPIQQTLMSALAEHPPGPGWFLAGTQAPAALATHTKWGFLRTRGLKILRALQESAKTLKRS